MFGSKLSVPLWISKVAMAGVLEDPQDLIALVMPTFKFFLTMIKDLIQVSASPEMVLTVPSTDVMQGAGSVRKGVCLKGNNQK